MARGPRPSAEDVLALHQFPETGEGRCIGPECGAWGLAVSEKDENQQMALHQIEMLAEAGYVITTDRSTT